MTERSDINWRSTKEKPANTGLVIILTRNKTVLGPCRENTIDPELDTAWAWFKWNNPE